MKKKTRPVNMNTALDALRTVLPENIVNFISLQIGLHKKNNKGQRYSNEVKSFALYPFFTSVAKLIGWWQNSSKLPCRSSLMKLVSGFPTSPGLSKVAKDMITTKVKMLDDMGKLCTLTMDEVSLKANLQYDESKDEVTGVEDFGKGKLVCYMCHLIN